MEIGTDRDRLASELDAVLAKGKTFHQCRLRHENEGQNICAARTCGLRLACAHQSVADGRLQARETLSAAINFLESENCLPEDEANNLREQLHAIHLELQVLDADKRWNVRPQESPDILDDETLAKMGRSRTPRDTAEIERLHTELADHLWSIATDLRNRLQLLTFSE